MPSLLDQRTISSASLHPDGWPQPVSLTQSLSAQSNPDVSKLFPESLAWASDYAHAVAASIQVSPLLVAPTMLAVASIAATGACRFEGRPGHQEVPVLWTMTLAPPGERKSATQNTVKAPLAPMPQEHDVAERQHRLAPNYSTDALMAMDLSRAAIYDLASSHHGRMALLTDEDYIVGKLAKPGADGLELFLKGWCGDSISKQRHSETVMVKDPNIVLSLLVQPDVAQLAIASDTLRGRGFPQRFIYVNAPAQSQRSYLDHNAVPDHLTLAWDRCIRDIAAQPRHQGARIIRLNPPAMAAFGVLADRLDGERLNENLDPFEREWLAKAHGQALRIAGLFALLRNASIRVITVEDVLAAEAWIGLSLNHLGALLRSMGGANQVTAQAQRVLRWLRQQGCEIISSNQITQALRGPGFDTVADWHPVFDLLVTNHWLHPVQMNASGTRGGRPSMGYSINPALAAEAA